MKTSSLLTAAFCGIALAASAQAAVIYSDNLNTGGGKINGQPGTFSYIPLGWTLNPNGNGQTASYSDFFSGGSGSDKLWYFYSNASNGSSLYTDPIAVSSLSVGDDLNWTMQINAYNYGSASAQQGIVYLEYLNGSFAQVAFDSQTYSIPLNNSSMSGSFSHSFDVSNATRAGAAYIRLTVAKNSGTGGAQMFDNIAIDHVAIPEPSTVMTLALTGAAFLVLRTRRRVS